MADHGPADSWAVIDFELEEIRDRVWEFLEIGWRGPRCCVFGREGETTVESSLVVVPSGCTKLVIYKHVGPLGEGFVTRPTIVIYTPYLQWRDRNNEGYPLLRRRGFVSNLLRFRKRFRWWVVVLFSFPRHF